MSILHKIKNIIHMIRAGQWVDLRYRLSVKWHGLDFAMIEDVEALGLTRARSKFYCDSGGPWLEEILKTIKISRSDAALDIGCGKGGAVITLARYPFMRVDGLELSESLIPIARNNLERMGITNATIHHADASQFAGYDNYTFFYLFNPFPAEVMRETLAAINVSLQRRPRPVTMVYMNPIAHQTVLDAGFRQVAELPHAHLPAVVYEGGQAPATA